MTIEERNKFIKEFILNDCLATLEGKGKDYATNEDANSNFKEVAKSLGLTEFQTWAIYFDKHVCAVLNSIRNNPEYPYRNSESLKESIKDIINYSGILLSLIQDKDNEIKKNFE